MKVFVNGEWVRGAKAEWTLRELLLAGGKDVGVLPQHVEAYHVQDLEVDHPVIYTDLSRKVSEFEGDELHLVAYLGRRIKGKVDA